MPIRKIDKDGWKLFIEPIDESIDTDPDPRTILNFENVQQFIGQFEGESEWKWFFHIRQDGIELLTDGERVWEKT